MPIEEKNAPVMTPAQWLTDSVISSSQNPQQVSLTVKGVLLKIVPIVLIAGTFVGGGAITEESLMTIVDNITMIVAGFFEIVSLIMITWGLIRKMLPKRK